jgi:peptide deformylase
MIRTILHYPDERLRQVGQKVTKVTREIQALVDDMAETMYAAPGVGLAATQIGEPVAIFVIDIAEADAPSELRVFINPEIIAREDEITWTEGCLSFPGVTEDVDRAAKVTVKGLDREGKAFQLEAEGLLAVAIQHELDHLNGVLMIDHLGPLKKRLVHRKMQKRQDAQSL